MQCCSHNNLICKISLAFLKFGRPFAITTCTHSNMPYNRGGLQPHQPPLTYTLVLWYLAHIIDTYHTKVKYLHCHVIPHCCMHYVKDQEWNPKIKIWWSTDGRGAEDKLHKQVCLEASVYSKWFSYSQVLRQLIFHSSARGASGFVVRVSDYTMKIRVLCQHL